MDDYLCQMHRVIPSHYREVACQIRLVNQIPHQGQRQIAKRGIFQQLSPEGKYLETELIPPGIHIPAQIAALLEHLENRTGRALGDSEAPGKICVVQTRLAFGYHFQDVERADYGRTKLLSTHKSPGNPAICTQASC